MPDLDDDDVLEPSEGGGGHDAAEVRVVAERIAKNDKRWKSSKALDIGDLRWEPSCIVADEKWVLHVHLSDEMARFAARRLRAAAEAGYRVHVALPMEALYDADVLDVLSDIDAHLYVVNDPEKPTERRHFLAAMADLGVAVEPGVRMRIGKAAWDCRGEGTAYERGRRLEALLAFLLSQVAELRVFSRNYRTATQEIDIVLQVDNFGKRCWVMPGVPFVLVESKNTEDVVGVQIVQTLVRRLQTKRGTARLGLLFSAAGFSSDAKMEELRGSESEYCVAMIDGQQIVALIEAADLDEALQKLVGKAMLR